MPAQTGQQAIPGPLDDTPEARRHATPEWQSVEAHLPDLQTSTAQKLEQTGDVLRARRFPDEALTYYQGALAHGGNALMLLNKMGVTELDLQQSTLATLDFKRAVEIDKNNADGWNNLGAVEYMRRHFGSAEEYYKKAVKLNKGSAVFHSNLANAYFDDKNFIGARKEFATVLRLDPHVFEYAGSVGMRMHLQSPEDRGRFCYELARLYAGEGNEANVLHWLAMASESGFDIKEAMWDDALMSKYRRDPRVTLIVNNSKALASGKPMEAGADLPLTPLPAAELQGLAGGTGAPAASR